MIKYTDIEILKRNNAHEENGSKNLSKIEERSEENTARLMSLKM